MLFSLLSNVTAWRQERMKTHYLAGSSKM